MLNCIWNVSLVKCWHAIVTSPWKSLYIRSRCLDAPGRSLGEKARFQNKGLHISATSSGIMGAPNKKPTKLWTKKCERQNKNRAPETEVGFPNSPHITWKWLIPGRSESEYQGKCFKKNCYWMLLLPLLLKWHFQNISRRWIVPKYLFQESKLFEGVWIFNNVGKLVWDRKHVMGSDVCHDAECLKYCKWWGQH